MKKWVYFFDEGSAKMKNLLGGKGANLAEMTRMGIPVPPGFTITTEACVEFFKNGNNFPDGLEEQVIENLTKLEEKTGKKLGDSKNPLLVSVRSGAPVSMPGMMDTILNLGLNDETVEGLAKLTGNPRFAYDCYRRFIAMFSDIVLGIDRRKFEEILEEVKKEKGVKYDAELDTESLKKLVEKYKKLVKEELGRGFPQDPKEQLFMAIKAVFNSWNNKRAITYREKFGIPHDMGTACNVQMMAFGNFGWDSGTGVMFTRNPSTGENKPYGEILLNAQGEDVVAGIRTPFKLEDLKEKMPEVYNQLMEIAKKLERHFRDVQDIEFTIERGKLYILQTRNGKRTPKAAVKIAVDMVREGLISEKEAVLRVSPSDIENLLHKQIDPKAERKVIAKGLAASPGAAVGKIVFDPDLAVELSSKGEKVILVRPETTPDDVHGMIAAQGILTSRGGMTSHAAVVARQLGKPAVVGCEEAKIDMEEKTVEMRGVVLNEGDYITIDGSTGEVMIGALPLVEPTVGEELDVLLSWADKYRKLGVFANADTKLDAERALEFGADGIGLARTEHMFLGPERVKVVQEMVLAKNSEERKKALEKLIPLQVKDFEELLKVMDGKMVHIRLLDPPLHEFLPKPIELLKEIHELEKSNTDPKVIEEKKRLLKAVERMQEANPMLGFRVCRLGIVYPEIYEAQVRALFEAACKLKKEGYNPIPEIMIPGTIDKKELEFLKERVNRVANEVMEKHGVKIDYKYGTMIEMPRAALTADEIAEVAEFFSFGTNDLTQTTMGLSRDDAQGTFLPVYLEKKILPHDPFKTLDFKGVGKLIKMCVELGRKTRKDLMIGICGEQGGDPETIEFLHKVGLDYVSCSPFRIPVARIAA
ncbi:MAG: pyruvate, phosphate dikinase, partial [Candidatus Odinarchaeota archaeon]|nr:pyruvate, phosphate dikinase [Candidatus Odinarchaeota archaeon]